MIFQSAAVLVSRRSWFVPYARKMVNLLSSKGMKSELFFEAGSIPASFEVVFVLSYEKLIPRHALRKHRHNLVVHESALPQGRGWAPLFWQVLEGKRKIPVVIFEAGSRPDAGDIYLKDRLSFSGTELHDEIRRKQAEKTVELCLRFLRDYRSLLPKRQKGRAAFYRKRTPLDSRLDPAKSISGQFNLLRIVNNKDFPAFFYHKGRKYILEIREDSVKSLMGRTFTKKMR